MEKEKIEGENAEGENSRERRKSNGEDTQVLSGIKWAVKSAYQGATCGNGNKKWWRKKEGQNDQKTNKLDTCQTLNHGHFRVFHDLLFYYIPWIGLVFQSGIARVFMSLKYQVGRANFLVEG